MTWHRPMACRRHGRGFTLLELLVVLSIIAVLATAGLERFWHLQEQAEHAAMEQSLLGLKFALRIQVATASAAQDPARLHRLAAGNPFDWLEERPANYAGEVSAATPDALPTGWAFARESATVLYRARHGEHLEGAGDGLLRFRLQPLDAAGQPVPPSSEFSTLALVPQGPYRWFDRPL